MDFTTDVESKKLLLAKQSKESFKIQQIIHITGFRWCANEPVSTRRGITEGPPQITTSSFLFFHSK